MIRVKSLPPGVYLTASCHRCKTMCAVPLPSGVDWAQLPPPVLLTDVQRMGVEIGSLLTFCDQHLRCGDGPELTVMTVSAGATS